MAGTQYSGFGHARANLYHNAPMVIVPPDFDSIELLTRVKELLAPAGFGRYSVTTAALHDEMIAFTSQMAHLVSNAYIKSPTAGMHKGFSAGSYKDLTRVAWMNAPMWSELFLENSDFMLRELDCLVENLLQYRAALAAGDGETLTALFRGRQAPQGGNRRPLSARAVLTRANTIGIIWLVEYGLRNQCSRSCKGRFSGQAAAQRNGDKPHANGTVRARTHLKGPRGSGAKARHCGEIPL